MGETSSKEVKDHVFDKGGSIQKGNSILYHHCNPIVGKAHGPNDHKTRKLKDGFHILD